MSQQCCDSACHGTYCSHVCKWPAFAARRFPDGCSGGCRLRFPDAHWSSMQYAGHGSGRLSVRRLRAPWSAAEPSGNHSGCAADFMVLAGTLTRSEEHTSELQSLMRISYAVFCLKKKTIHNQHNVRDTTDTHTPIIIVRQVRTNN